MIHVPGCELLIFWPLTIFMPVLGLLNMIVKFAIIGFFVGYPLYYVLNEQIERSKDN